MRWPSLIALLVLLTPPVSGGGVSWTSKWMVVTVTAYCPCKVCCGRFSDGLTFTESNAWKPGVAVDPAVIPLGSRLDIPGYWRGSNKNGSWIRADDIGSGVTGNEIDVRFSTHSEALKWGRRKKVRVRVWLRKQRAR